MTFDPADPLPERYFTDGSGSVLDSEVGDYLNSLCSAKDIQQIHEAQRVMSDRGRQVLWAYAFRAAPRAVRSQDSELLVPATVALVLGGLDQDFSEALTVVPMVEDACQRLGVDVRDIFALAAEVLGLPASRSLRRWLARQPANRTLACMGYRAEGDGADIRYVEIPLAEQ